MPKIELTDRRKVEAHGPWFDVEVDLASVRVHTPFGVVYVKRTNKGLETTFHVDKLDENFLEVGSRKVFNSGHVEQRFYDVDIYQVNLRPVGLVQLQEWAGEPDEMPAAKKRLRDYVLDWLKRNKR